jgi:glycosyltransferase involved in cell wall biosynthesis
MRVLFIAPYGAQGGSENVLVNVLERLDRERFDPHVLMLERGGLRERIAELGIPTLVQHLPGKQGVLKIPAAARRIPEGFDVIHANGGKAAVYALPLARRLKIPLVWMKHDHSYDGRLARLLARRCDHVVCVSHAMAGQFDDMRDRVSVVYPGVITRDLKPVEQTAPTVVSVGRLDPYKGFDQVLAAIAELRAAGVEVGVRIAGPQDRIHTETEGELKRLAASLGLGADTVGWADDLDQVYEQARVVVLASKPKGEKGAPGEGAPLVLMEGMGAARPVVGTSLPGIAEVIQDCGTLVDPPDAANLARALRPYLEDPQLAAQTGAKGRVRVEELMTLDRTVAELAALYERLVHKPAIP